MASEPSNDPAAKEVRQGLVVLAIIAVVIAAWLATSDGTDATPGAQAGGSVVDATVTACPSNGAEGEIEIVNNSAETQSVQGNISYLDADGVQIDTELFVVRLPANTTAREALRGVDEPSAECRIMEGLILFPG